MKKTIAALTLCLLVGVLALQPVTADPASVEPVGAANYFFCAAFQTIKIAGFLTGQPAAVLAGAIGGGLSCGFGW